MLAFVLERLESAVWMSINSIVLNSAISEFPYLVIEERWRVKKGTVMVNLSSPILSLTAKKDMTRIYGTFPLLIPFWELYWATPNCGLGGDGTVS